MISEEGIGRSIKVSDGRVGTVFQHTEVDDGLWVDIDFEGRREGHSFPSEQAFLECLQGTYKLYYYCGPHRPEQLDQEFHLLEKALNACRSDWGQMIRLEKPDGENYQFKGEEWDLPLVVNHVILRKGPFTARQNWKINKLKEKQETRWLLGFLGRPFDLDVRTENFGLSADELKSVLLDLLHENILELVPYGNGGPCHPEHHAILRGTLRPRKV